MSSNRLNEGISKLRARDPNVSIDFNPERSAVSILLGKLSEPAKASELKKSPFVHARGFISENKALLGDVDEAKTLDDGRVLTDDVGGIHVVFYQKYGEARVLGRTISVHYDKDGTINLIKSNLVEKIDLPLKPEIKPEQAAEIAVKDAGKGAEAFREKTPELLVVGADTAKIEGKGPKNYLCWQIGVVYPGGETGPDWIYFVDALTGKVLFRTSAEPTATGLGLYSNRGVRVDDLHSSSGGGTHNLLDTVTTSTWGHDEYVGQPEIHTYDNAGSGDRSLRNFSQDGDNNWDNELTPPANPDDDQRQEVDIHRFLSHVVNYYYQYHYRGIDYGGHLNVVGHAHTGSLCNDAAFNLHYEQFYFNSGDWVTRKFISTLDIVGHEFTHAVLFESGILQDYRGETAAVNEAICDLFGTFIALQHREDCTQPWRIGQESYFTGRGRDLTNPSCDSSGVRHYIPLDAINSANAGYYPDHYRDLYTGPHDLAHDLGGVHINSTILSHAVFLMAQGGTNRSSGVRVTGIGIEPVRLLLWRIISNGLLDFDSDFADFRKAFILACLLEYPLNLDYLATVKTAFYAAGIGPDLYIRDRREDHGDEPGDFSNMSPDIILRRRQADDATRASIANTDNESLSQPAYISPTGGAEDHYVYFRIFNRGWASASGTFRLFVAPESSYANPVSWTEVGHFDFLPVPARSHWVPTAPGQCIPFTREQIERLGDGNFCFIGIVDSIDDKPPDYTRITHWVPEYNILISKSNNYACLNFQIQRGDFHMAMIIPVLVMPDDPFGDVPQIEQLFEIKWLAGRQKGRAFEIDTRNMPEGTRIIAWMPESQLKGIKAFTSQALKEGIPDEKVELYPVALDELAASGDDLKLEPKAIAAGQLKQWSPLRMTCGKLTRFVGIDVAKGEQMDIPFVVKFPGGVRLQDATLIFRDRMKDEAQGEMSYIFRISNK
jgi:Zn-dependent metalloprotease